jgi:hypothetical protein
VAKPRLLGLEILDVSEVPRVRRKAEATVGLDRVRAVLLKHVRAQLVDEPDPAPLLVGCVNEDAASFSCNCAPCLSKLRAAVTAKRPQRVTGQALRVEPGQDRVAVADLAAHEREVHPPGRKLERVQLELPEGGTERKRGDRAKRHSELL